jgi:predicted nucleotide-binding protein
MTKIDRRLMDQLKKRMGAAESTVYSRIQKTAAANRVTRDLAALLLAGENGISYEKYATTEQMAQLRGAPMHAPHADPGPRATPTGRPRPSKKPVVTVNNNYIFVVHGRDVQLNTDMFAFLRAIGQNPLEWSQAITVAKGANPHVDQVISDAMEKVQGVLVMFSPDEEARLKAKFCSGLDKKKGFNKLDGQARPNVIFEAGLALGAHSKKTLLVRRSGCARS